MDDDQFLIDNEYVSTRAMLPRQSLSVSNFTDLPIYAWQWLRRALQKETAVASGHRLASSEWLAIVSLSAPNGGRMMDAPIERGLLLKTCIGLKPTVRTQTA
jgi:hypothetical protein